VRAGVAHRLPPAQSPWRSSVCLRVASHGRTASGAVSVLPDAERHASSQSDIISDPGEKPVFMREPARPVGLADAETNRSSYSSTRKTLTAIDWPNPVWEFRPFAPLHLRRRHSWPVRPSHQ
jgi:hypothetical protein